MDVETESVVPPRDVLEIVGDAAVVRRVDDALVLPRAPRVCPGRPEPDVLLRGKREQPVAALGLARNGVHEVLSLARSDLDLRRDQLTGNRLRKQVVFACGREQALERVRQREVRRIEQSELFLEPDREVGRGFERLPRLIEVEAQKPRLPYVR
jgi:hypothetical protein